MWKFQSNCEPTDIWRYSCLLLSLEKKSTDASLCWTENICWKVKKALLLNPYFVQDQFMSRLWGLLEITCVLLLSGQSCIDIFSCILVSLTGSRYYHRLVRFPSTLTVLPRETSGSQSITVPFRKINILNESVFQPRWTLIGNVKAWKD